MAYTREELMAEKERRKQLKAIQEERQKRQAMKSGQNQMQSEMGLYESLNNNPQLQKIANSYGVQGILGFGDKASNMLSNAASSVVSPISKAFGGEEIRSEKLKSGQGPAYEIGEIAAEVAPFLAPQSMGTRMGTSMLVGGFENQDNPYAGIAEGAAFGLAGEALPKVAQGAGKGLDWAADKFTRNKYTADLMSAMTENFKKTQEDALGFLNPLLDKYGDKKLNLEGISQIMSNVSENAPYLVGKNKKSYETFLKDPTLGNAQRLQSELGKKVRTIKGKDSTSINEIEAMNEIRESIIESMSNGFENMSPGASDIFDMFRTKYATGPAQYLNDPTLRKIVMGSRREMTPNKVEKALSKSVEGESNIPREHAIRAFQEEMVDKLNRSKLYKQASVLGPIGSHYGFDLTGAIQNPQAANVASKLGAPYRPAAQSVIGTKLSNDEGDEQSLINRYISQLINK